MTAEPTVTVTGVRRIEPLLWEACAAWDCGKAHMGIQPPSCRRTRPTRRWAIAAARSAAASRLHAHLVKRAEPPFDWETP